MGGNKKELIKQILDRERWRATGDQRCHTGKIFKAFTVRIPSAVVVFFWVHYFFLNF